MKYLFLFIVFFHISFQALLPLKERILIRAHILGNTPLHLNDTFSKHMSQFCLMLNGIEESHVFSAIIGFVFFLCVSSCLCIVAETGVRLSVSDVKSLVPFKICNKTLGVLTPSKIHYHSMTFYKEL